MYANAPFVSINCGSIPAPLLSVEVIWRMPKRICVWSETAPLSIAARNSSTLSGPSRVSPRSRNQGPLGFVQGACRVSS